MCSLCFYVTVFEKSLNFFFFFFDRLLTPQMATIVSAIGSMTGTPTEKLVLCSEFEQILH